MTTLSPAQVYDLARSVGLGPYAAVIATGIAGAESGFRTDAIGDTALEDGTWGPSVGLWQIRSLKAETGKGTPRDASHLTDPVFNAQAMKSISSGGTSWGAWSTYKSGAYKNFTKPAATEALAEGDDPSAQTGNPLGQAASNILNSIGLGGAVSVATGTGQAVSGLTSNWGADALKIGLYLVLGGSAAALVIVGAVHTVSSK